MRWPNIFKVNDTFEIPTIAMDVTVTMLDATQKKVKIIPLMAEFTGYHNTS
jgi:hypothetical protein